MHEGMLCSMDVHLGDGSPLTEADMRAVVHLLGDVIACQGSYADKKRHLMDGLCHLIDADAWVWTLAQVGTDRPATHVGFIHGGFDDGRFARFLEAIEHPETHALSAPFIRELYAGEQSQLTRVRQQLDPEDKFVACDAHALWKDANIGPLLFSARSIADGGVSGIGLYRNFARPSFSERDARIAHILLSEVSWLHGQDWPEDRGETVVKLPPRQRVVLNAMIQGWNRKKIADHLGLSVNTVHGYAKNIFQHFQVHSQAELVSRFSWGDGGDTPRLGSRGRP